MSVVNETRFLFQHGNGFSFQPDACNWFHDLLMMSMNVIHIIIPNIHSVYYCYILTGLAKMRRLVYLKMPT